MMGDGMGLRTRVVRLTTSVVAVVGVGLLAVDLPAGAASHAQLKAKALSLSDMPAGWSVDNSSSAGTTNLGGCLKNLQALGHPAKGISRAEVKFTDQQLPDLQETIESGKGATQRYTKYLGILNGCKSISFTESDGTQVTGSVGAMSFPTLGSPSSVQSDAFALNLTIKGINATIDVIMFRVGQIDGELLYADLSPDTATVQAFATEAVNKIEGKTVTPPTQNTP